MISNTNTSQNNVKNNKEPENTKKPSKSNLESKIKNTFKKVRSEKLANKISIPTSGNNPYSFNRIGRTKLIQMNENKKEDNG